MKFINTKNLEKRQQGVLLQQKQKFRFLCHKNLKCFNNCCKNINMFLYPYDILRLKNNLKIKSSSFIEKYTDLITRGESCFPDVLLRMNGENMSCPFLSESGCSVYLDRPYTCRMFPVEQAKSFNSNTALANTANFFRPPDFCMGQNENSSWTIKTWIEAQNAEDHIRMTSQWASVKQPLNTTVFKETAKNNQKIKMSFMASYDIDTFRKFVFESSFLKRYKIKQNTLNKIQSNEKELLKLGFEWIKFFMWGIPSSSMPTLLKSKIN